MRSPPWLLHFAREGRHLVLTRYLRLLPGFFLILLFALVELPSVPAGTSHRSHLPRPPYPVAAAGSAAGSASGPASGSASSGVDPHGRELPRGLRPPRVEIRSVELFRVGQRCPASCAVPRLKLSPRLVQRLSHGEERGAHLVAVPQAARDGRVARDLPPLARSRSGSRQLGLQRGLCRKLYRRPRRKLCRRLRRRLRRRPRRRLHRRPHRWPRRWPRRRPRRRPRLVRGRPPPRMAVPPLSLTRPAGAPPRAWRCTRSTVSASVRAPRTSGAATA